MPARGRQTFAVADGLDMAQVRQITVAAVTAIGLFSPSCTGGLRRRTRRRQRQPKKCASDAPVASSSWVITGGTGPYESLTGSGDVTQESLSDRMTTAMVGTVSEG